IRSFIQGELADQDVKLQIKITYKGKLVAEDAVKVTGAEVRRSIRMENLNEHGMDYLWWPERPNLFDVEFTLFQDGQEADHVSSYFGMRKVSVENGKFNLNNRPYKMKLVLDQGYFPDGNLTPPSDEAIRRDVELTKE